MTRGLQNQTCGSLFSFFELFRLGPHSYSDNEVVDPLRVRQLVVDPAQPVHFQVTRTEQNYSQAMVDEKKEQQRVLTER